MLDRTRIILVRPQHSGNIGAAARAMQNMGLNDLVVVDPPSYDPETARWLAPGCSDMVASVRVVPTVLAALEGIQVCVATTARHRKQLQPVTTPSELARRIATEPARFAILFGREDFGLSTEDSLHAESLLRIPTPEHASLNLGQAVLLVSYALFEEARTHGPVATGRTLGGTTHTSTRRKSKPDRRQGPAGMEQLEPVVEEAIQILERVGYFRSTPPTKVRLTLRQTLQRAKPNFRHTEAFRGMLSRIRWALENPEADPRAVRFENPNNTKR